MKKVLIASGVAVLAFAMVAGAQGMVFSTNLTVGSTGADVSALQTWLNANGFKIPAVASGAVAPGYFGAQTKAAVQAYQTSKGIPSTGFVGPLTRAALNGTAAPVTTTTGFVCPVGYSCTANPGTTAPVVSTGALAGTDGTLGTFTRLSQYTNEEVGDGQSDVKVLGYDVKASKDGDIALKSTKVTFVIANSSGSTRLNDYISSVSVWLGSTKIGTASAADFNKDSTGNYSKTITLSNAVLKSDVTNKLYFTVNGQTNLDSGDIDSETVTIDVENVRFEDGAGVVTTDTTTGDIDAVAGKTNIAFVSFATSADTELKAMSNSSSPDTGIVVVNASSDTENVVLLVGNLRLDGTSDVTLNELPITLTTNGDSLAAVANTLTLKIDGEEYSESVSISDTNTGTVTFDDLDLNLDAGKTYSFSILADVNDIENTGVTATDFDEGDYLVASFTATNRQYMDVENETGDQLANTTEKTGTVTGKAQEFRTKGIALTLESTATDATVGQNATDDVGLFTIRYKVTAIGDTIYVSSLTTAGGLSYAVDKGGTATTSATITASLVNKTDTDLTSVGNFEIAEGTSETFVLSVSVPISSASGSGQYRTALTGVKWDTTDTTSLSYTYTSELDSFKTDYKVLN